MTVDTPAPHICRRTGPQERSRPTNRSERSSRGTPEQAGAAGAVRNAPQFLLVTHWPAAPNEKICTLCAFDGVQVELTIRGHLDVLDLGRVAGLGHIRPQRDVWHVLR